MDLSTKEVSSILGVSSSQIALMVKSKRLTLSGKTPGGKFIFSPDDIKNYLNNQKERQATVISMSNKKGGVGKTFFTLNIASALKFLGLRVLVIDADDQANLTSTIMGRIPLPEEPTLLEIFNSNFETNAIYTTESGIDIIPSNLSLEEGMINVGSNTKIQLNKYIQKYLLAKYDYILIDTPPYLHLTTESALVASDFVIIPIIPDDWSTRGVEYLVKKIEMVNETYQRNGKCTVLGCVFNLVHPQRGVDSDFIESVEEQGNILKGQHVFESRFSNKAKQKEDIIINNIHITNRKLKGKHIKNLINLTMEIFNGINQRKKTQGY